MPPNVLVHSHKAIDLSIAASRFYPFAAPGSNVRFLKNWKSENLLPPPTGIPETSAQGPDPARHPRPPDYPPLGRFQPRHPNPHAVSNRATLSHSRDRIFDGDFRFSEFQIFGGAKVKSRVNTPIQIRATHKPASERIHIIANISRSVGFGSGPDRIRIRFGWH